MSVTEGRGPAAFCAAAFVVKDGTFLFGKRADDKRAYAAKWDIVGGHSNKGETPLETMLREVREEIGIVPTEYEFAGEADMDDEYIIVPYKLHLFFVTGWTGEPSNCCEEHSELRWFTREELDAVALSSRKYLDFVDLWLKTGLSVLPSNC